MPTDIVRFTVSLPVNLLSELDNRIISKGYSSRSELVRDLIREQLISEKWASGNVEVVGVLTISYDHHQQGLVQNILDLQHSRFVHVLCNTHIHLNHNNCLEVIIIRGRPSEIEKLSLELGGLKGVKFSKLTRTAGSEI